MPRWRRESILDLYNLLLALFAFMAPWLFAYADRAARIDLWTSGAMIAVISLASFVAFSRWQEWLNLLLGIWLVASPWVLGFAHTRPMHVGIAVGVMVAFLAALELWLVHSGRSEQPSFPAESQSG